MSYYRLIDGRCYDHRILNLADRVVREQADRHISELDIQQLCQTIIEENGVLTTLEVNTIQLIQARYPMTAKAREWLSAQSFAMAGTADVISRVSADRLDFFHIDAEIDEEEVLVQSQANNPIGFEEAFVKALLLWRQPNRYEGWLPLSPLFEDEGNEDEELQLVSSGLEGLSDGIVYLVPAEAAKPGQPPFVYPLPLSQESDTDAYWIFGIQSNDAPELALFSYVSRSQPNDYFGRCLYIGGRTLQDRLGKIADAYLDAEDMEIYVDEAELLSQQERFGGLLDIPSVFYYAIYNGLMDAEGSMSFKELASQESWVNHLNLDQSFELLLTRYLGYSRFYLLPADWAKNRPTYPLPAWFDGDFSRNWYFVMEFPDLTHHRFIISLSRQSTHKNIEASSTSYVSEYLGDVQTQIEQVLRQEFKLEGMHIAIDAAEFERQHVAFDPFWREPATVVRQVVNTLLNDFSSTGSFLTAILEVFPNILLENVDDPEEMLNELAQKAMECMDEATLYLLPETIYELDEYELGEYLMPTREELVELNYLFQLSVPMLQDVPTFFIVIPRETSLSSAPFNYLEGSVEEVEDEDDDEHEDDDE